MSLVLVWVLGKSWPSGCHLGAPQTLACPPPHPPRGAPDPAPSPWGCLGPWPVPCPIPQGAPQTLPLPCPVPLGAPRTLARPPPIPQGESQTLPRPPGGAPDPAPSPRGHPGPCPVPCMAPHPLLFWGHRLSWSRSARRLGVRGLPTRTGVIRSLLPSVSQDSGPPRPPRGLVADAREQGGRLRSLTYCFEGKELLFETCCVLRARGRVLEASLPIPSVAPLFKRRGGCRAPGLTHGRTAQEPIGTGRSRGPCVRHRHVRKATLVAPLLVVPAQGPADEPTCFPEAAPWAGPSEGSAPTRGPPRGLSSALVSAAPTPRPRRGDRAQHLPPRPDRSGSTRPGPAASAGPAPFGSALPFGGCGAAEERYGVASRAAVPPGRHPGGHAPRPGRRQGPRGRHFPPLRPLCAPGLPSWARFGVTGRAQRGRPWPGSLWRCGGQRSHTGPPRWHVPAHGVHRFMSCCNGARLPPRTSGRRAGVQ